MGTDRTAFPPKKPARKKSSSLASRNDGTWQGWVNVNLPPSVKAQWMEWSKDTNKFYDAFGQMVGDGYKLTVKYEEQHNCFSAFVTQQSSGHDDFGWGLSERAGDPFTAIHRVVYIHAVILGGDWAPYKTSTGFTDRWE